MPICAMVGSHEQQEIVGSDLLIRAAQLPLLDVQMKGKPLRCEKHDESEPPSSCRHESYGPAQRVWRVRARNALAVFCARHECSKSQEA
jgi:hypothetical protein